MSGSCALDETDRVAVVDSLVIRSVSEGVEGDMYSWQSWFRDQSVVL